MSSDAEYEQLLAEIANQNPSSSVDASHKPVPTETRETRETFDAFKGQGYKLDADEPSAKDFIEEKHVPVDLHETASLHMKFWKWRSLPKRR